MILVFITVCGFSLFLNTAPYLKTNKNIQEIIKSPEIVIKKLEKVVVDKINSEKILEKQIRLLLVGDIMMDRYIRSRSEKLGYGFYYECAAPTFAKYDFVVANLESTVTNYPSVSISKPQEDYNHFKFTIDPAALIAIKNAGINVLGVDNNHIYDFGKEGIELTRKNILASSLNYFGDPIDSSFSNLRLEKDGIAFSLVSFNEFFGSAEKTLKNIEKAKTLNLEKNNNFEEPIIIFAHWGDEYVPAPERVKNWTRSFIDAGADVIIGMHPHVVQETDTYKEKFISYSLGNFVFDQYFSPEVQKGGAVEVILNKNGILSTRFFNVYLDSERRPCIAE